MDSNATSSGGTPAPSLYPGESAPLTVITATDQSGVVLIGTALALIFAAISMLIRLYVRLEFRHNFAKDDLASLISMVLFVIQSALVFIEVSKGFGKTIDDLSSDDLVAWQKDSYASDLVYILILWMTKCSVAFLFLRLSPDRKHILCANATLITCTVMMVISMIIIAVRCNTMQPWIFVDDQCANLFIRWQVVAAFDIITEVSLFGIAVYMTYGLQLSFSNKTVVLLAFALRLPIVAPALFRLHYLASEFSTDDPTLQGVLASICTQIELSYAIIATTTPCLRPFMSALNTHYGGPMEPKTTPNQTKLSKLSKPETSDNEFPMTSMRSRTRHEPHDSNDETTEPPTRWDQTDYRVTVIKGDQRSTRSDDSRQMIISKDTQWSVEYNQQQSA